MRKCDHREREKERERPPCVCFSVFGTGRFLDALAALRAAHPRLLVVTHGDLLAAAVSSYLGEDVLAYDVEECGYLVFERDELVHASRVQLLGAS